MQQISITNDSQFVPIKPTIHLDIVADEKYMPSYANDTDACMDLKACIQNQQRKDRFFDSTNYPDTETGLWIMPGETRKIGSGVKVAIPEGFVMQMFVRSSTGIKKKLMLANGTGIIDAGYRDEIIMALHNFGNSPVGIADGDRICQFILLPFDQISLNKVEDDDNFRNGDRGGGIGSTGV